LVATYFLKVRHVPEAAVASRFPLRKLMAFSAPIIAFSSSFVLMTNLDLLFVKAITGDYASAGYYTSAATLAHLPLVVMTALNMVILPLVSHSTSSDDVRRTRRYVSASTRYLLMALLPCTALPAVTAPAFVELIYSESYSPAAPAFALLIVGIGMVTIFRMFSTILIAGGRPWSAMFIGALQLALSVALYVLLIPVFGLVGAAASIVAAGLLGMLTAGALVLHEHGIVLHRKSLLRIVAALILPLLLAVLLPLEGLLLIPWYLALLGVYASVLYLSGELEANDLRLIACALGLKRRNRA